MRFLSHREDSAKRGRLWAETRQTFDQDFRGQSGWSGRQAGRVRIARDVGINEALAAYWVILDRRRRGAWRDALTADKRAEQADCGVRRRRW